MTLALLQSPDSTPKFVKQAPWLLSDYSTSRWIVIDGDVPKERAASAVIDFDYPLPVGGSLLHPRHSHLLTTVKAHAFALRTGPQATINTAATHYSSVKAMLNIVGWMVVNGIMAFARLTPGDVAALLAVAPYGVGAILDARRRVADVLARDDISAASCSSIAAAARLPRCVVTTRLLKEIRAVEIPKSREALRHFALQRLLKPLEDIWLMRDWIGGDVISFQPYPEGSSHTAIRLGSANRRTKTLPVRQAMFLIDGCVRWVLHHGNQVIDLYEKCLKSKMTGDPDRPKLDTLTTMAQGIGLPSGGPWPISFKNRRSNAPTDSPANSTAKTITVNYSIELMACACFVICIAFTARRIEEILSAQINCITGSSDNGYWIETFIEKTMREVDRTPCPEVVVAAIRLMERLNASAQKFGEKSKLFQWLRLSPAPHWNPVHQLDPGKVINELAVRIGVPPLTDGTQWHFSSHQFRRFFSMLYMWRWHNGDLGALAHQLRHFNLNMTRTYVTDVEAGAILAEARNTFTNSILTDVASGDRRVGGAAGERFKLAFNRLRQRLASELIPISMERLERWVERFVQKGHIAIKSNPWSYCLCPNNYTGAVGANCREDRVRLHDVGPNLAGARPELCRGCKYNMTDPVFAPFLATEVQHAERLLDSLSKEPTILRNATERRLEILRSYLGETLRAQPVECK